MSKDSSSKSTSEKQKNILPDSLKALITIVAVVVGFLAAQFVGIVLFVSVLNIAGLSSEQVQNAFDSNSWVQFSAILVIEVLTLALVYCYFKLARRQPMSYLKLDKKPTKRLFATVGVTYLIYFPVFVAIATVASLLIPSLDTEQMQQIGFENTKGIDYLAVFLSLAVVVPFVEELVFRGILFQKLRQYSGIVPAVLFTSIIFGAAHLEFFADGPLNYIAAIDTFVFSLFLIAVYVKTNSLWAPILLHALKNSVAFVFLFLI